MTGTAVRWILGAIETGRRLAEAAATLAFAGMVGLFGWTIWQRYGVGLPSRWSDELCSLVFLWVVFGAAALVVPLKDQIAVGLVHDAASPGIRRIMDVAGFGIAGVILLATLPVTVDYVVFLRRERTPALMWPLDRAYAVFALFQGMIGLRLVLRAAAAILGRDTPLASGPAAGGPVASGPVARGR